MKPLFSFLFVLLALSLSAEDGSKLWLRAAPTVSAPTVTGDVSSPTAAIAASELRRFYPSAAHIRLLLNPAMRQDEGYSIAVETDGGITVSAHCDAGLLYGAFALLRQQAVGEALHSEESHPAFALRMLNHWDNLDGTIERGYAGTSIFWGDNALPKPETLTQYARANASVGINATVLNNVNASPKMLTKGYLKKVKAIADALRPYHIRVFLSVNFASPMADGLKTADPLNPKVRLWWQKKAREIYNMVPDFGGFLVKANSEGQPGPGDYHRSHAEGANMLAEALAPHKGTVVWRAFVYGYHDGEDRVKKAVTEFQPLDGQFLPNVILQVKNGPLDFQPREPYSPLFDQMHRTPLMAELQITQEYTGQSRHLVYLGPMWTEFFGFVKSETLTGVAGVANIGNDPNWCGHHFSQANWYAFGRLAWNPAMPSVAIAREWLRQTFSSNAYFLNAMTQVMETSREACVDYMMPLGLHHIFKGDHHYGPEPDGNQPNFPDEWKPVWYHKADAEGVGFNRSSTGTNATAQYRSPYREMYDNVKTCPERYLLWFHHVAWDYRMENGRTLWQNLNDHYNHGVDQVDHYAAQWQQMRPYVDAQRWEEVNERLKEQQQNARQWRDVCLDYFGKIKN